MSSITSPLAAAAVMVAIATMAGGPLPAFPFATLGSGTVTIVVAKISVVTVANLVTMILTVTFMALARHRAG